MTTRISLNTHLGVIAALAACGAFAAAPAFATSYLWKSGGDYNNTDVSPDAPSTLLSGDTLTIDAGGYFNGIALTTISGSNTTWAGGTLGFQDGATVVNSGIWNSDSASATSMYDAGYGGTFTNAAGYLRNGGTGALSIDASGSFSFVNNAGKIYAASGSITFVSGSASQVQFNTGSIFEGSGPIVFGGGGAQFTGTQTFASGSNAVFAAGYFTNGSPTSAAATLTGNATWSGGQFYTGSFSLSSGSTLTAGTTPGGNTKAFDGVSFTNGGTISWTTADAVLFESGATLTNNGSFVASAATTLEDGGYGGTFINNGTFADTGGGIVTVNTGSFTFQNAAGGKITASNATDSIDFISGSYGQITFANQTNFGGAGTINIGDGGNGATFNGNQNIAAGTTFLLTGGYFAAGANGATLIGNSTWNGGSFYNENNAASGAWTLPTGSTLSVYGTPGGNTKSFDAAYFVNNGTIAWKTADPVLFGSGSTLTNNGSFIASAATSLYDGGYGGTFVNNGTLADSGGGTVTVSTGGDFSFQNNARGQLTATNTGDTLVFTSQSNSQTNFANTSSFGGAGTIEITGNGATFTGNQIISGSTNFVLAGGYFVSSPTGATLDGNSTWTGGAFNSASGSAWTLASGFTMNVDTTPGGNTKAFNAANFVNNGTIAWTTADPVLFESGSTLTNNGSFIASAATTLYDGGYGGTFINAGTLADTGGGTVTVSTGGSFSFQNNSGGTVTATNAGDTLLFTSQSSTQTTFANNSNFAGAGTIDITGDGATFTGNQTIASGTNFVLAGGYFVPGTGGATLNGQVSWTGGQFYSGTWNVATGSTVNVATTPGGNTKYFNATNFTNNGTINWATADAIYFANGAAVTNNGALNISADASFADGSYGGSFVNNGVLSKTGGTGTTSVAPTGSFQGLVNNGVTQVLSGTIALGSTFTNPGTLAGTGTFTAGTLTNNGTVLPGTYLGAPATLALTGNYLQGTTGILGIGANGTTNGLFAVSGTATLAGTVDVNCVGSCTYTKGTDLLILTSTGLTVDPTTIVQKGFTGSNDFSLQTIGNSEYLVVNNNVSAVPEPSTYAMMLAGAGLLYGVSRRRRFVPA